MANSAPGAERTFSSPVAAVSPAAVEPAAYEAAPTVVMGVDAAVGSGCE